MIPESKKLLQALGKALFKTEEQRLQEAEQQRDVRIRLGKARIRRHLTQQQRMSGRLKELAKRALAIGDEARFNQVGRQLLWTQKDVQRWESYLLTLDVLEARRDQATATRELIQAISSMSDSLAELAGPEKIAELHQQLETNLVRTTGIEEQLDLMMDLMDSAFIGEAGGGEDELAQLQAHLAGEVAADESARFDPEIEAGLEKIRQEMERDRK